MPIDIITLIVIRSTDQAQFRAILRNRKPLPRSPWSQAYRAAVTIQARP